MHHAYLFVGPEGVGKLQTAIALAEALNCVNRPDDTFVSGCGQCPSCRRIAVMQHPDVHLVQAEGQNIKIDQIRAIQKVATRRPYEGRFQVVIVNQAHQMGDEAANALLKTLEEPPPAMRFAVVTDQPNRLLDTIRSRCQLLRFGGLAEHDVLAVLRRHAVADKGWTELQMAAATRYAEGSPGRAFNILESGVLQRRADAIDLWLKIDPVRAKSMLDAADSMQKDKKLLLEFVDILKVFLRDIMLVKTLGSYDRCVNIDLPAQLHMLSEMLDMDGVLARIELLDRTQRLLERPISGQLIAEDLFLKLALPRNP